MKKTINVVGCILQLNDTILLLYRSETESDPNLWGIPAGKADKDETFPETIRRELTEETGITLPLSDFTLVDSLKINYPEVIVNFPIFHISLIKKPDIVLDPSEHSDYAWIKPLDALNKPDLMKDVDIIINDVAIKKLNIR